MSDYTAPSGDTEPGQPGLSPAEQFEAWVANRADVPPAFPPVAPAAVPPVPPSFPPSGPTGAGPSGGWPLPSGPEPGNRRRRSAVVAVATTAAVALGSFGFAAGLAYHREKSAGAAPASSAGPNFGFQGGGLDPFGSGSSGSSGGGALGGGSFGGGSFGNGSFGNGSSGNGSSGSASSAPTDAAASKVAAAVDPGIVDINTQIDYGSAAVPARIFGDLAGDRGVARIPNRSVLQPWSRTRRADLTKLADVLRQQFGSLGSENVASQSE